MGNLLGAISLIVGGFLALLLLIITFKPPRLSFSVLILGAAAFLIALFLQGPTQQIPLVLVGVRTLYDIVARGFLFIVATSLYMGFIAGIFQEVFKYLFIKKGSPDHGLQVGLGFGLAELIYLATYAFMSLAIFGVSSEGGGFVQYTIPGIERFLVLIFHTLTALYMCVYKLRGLLIAILSHGAIDSLAACMQIYARVIGYDATFYASMALLYASILAINLLLIRPSKRAYFSLNVSEKYSNKNL